MRLPRSHDADGSDVGVLPMINVVFLLLVFFMVAGAIGPIAPFDTEPPKTDRSGTASDATHIVHLDATGLLALDGKQLSRSELPTALSAMSVDAESDTSETLPAFALESDAGVPFSTLRDTIDALRDAGIDELDLITSPVPAVAR